MHKYSRFFNEIFASPVISHEQGMVKYLPVLKEFFNKGVISLPERPTLKMSLFDMFGMPVRDEDIKTVNSVAVISIQGVLTRAGSWWDPGTEEIADLIQKAWDEESISAVVLKSNCYGGATDALSPIEAVFGNKNKPCIGVVDSNAYSLGYFNLLFCDQIWAVNKMCGVGSIGVMATMFDKSEMYKEYGIKQIVVYPPESNWKNRPVREALEGNPELLIKEELSPWAQYFQETARARRPNLNEAIEGTLSGRTFFANYTNESAMMNGLIDGVMPFADIIKYAANLSSAQKARTIFNN